MTENPKVSIVIPTYNRPQLLARALESVSRQTMRSFEVIVVDDRSTLRDVYNKTIAEYKSAIPNFKYLVNNGRKGAPACRNAGIKIATGKYIALLDDDDEWLPEKLEEQVGVFESAGECTGLVYTWADCIDPGGTRVYQFDSCFEGLPLKELLYKNFIPSSSVMLSRQALSVAGVFDESLPSCQDWDLWVRILGKGFECRVSKKTLMIYHKHNQNSIGTSRRAMVGYRKFYSKHFRRYIASGLTKELMLRLAYSTLHGGLRI